MTRLIRVDVPGAVFHVANRGVARRSILENDAERRFFLSVLARGVRKRWIRAHAYCLMTNHYHMLVSSEGHLSTFMQWGTSWFARRFNNRRGRDGPLFRGRYWARRIRSDADFRNVLRYIHHNPVAAGLVREPRVYPWSSALHHERRSHRPRWLCRNEVERIGATFGEAAPSELAPLPAGASLAWWIERRLDIAFADEEQPPAPDAAGATETDVIRWLECAESKGRRRSRLPIAPLPAILDELNRRRGLVARHAEPADRRVGDPWEALRCGLLHAACGLSDAEIADLTGGSRKTTRSARARHIRLLRQGNEYAIQASRIVLAARRVLDLE